MIVSLNIKKIIYSVDNDFICCKPCEYSTNHISQGNRFLVSLKNKNKNKIENNKTLN